MVAMATPVAYLPGRKIYVLWPRISVAQKLMNFKIGKDLHNLVK